MVLTSFYIHHIGACEQPACCLKFHQVSTRPCCEIRKLLGVFLREELLVLAANHPALHHFLIFNFFDKSHLTTTYFDSHNFFHVRERHRFFERLGEASDHKGGEPKEVEGMEEIEDRSREVDLIPEIWVFVATFIEFWEELIMYNVNATKVITLGVKQVQYFKAIKEVLLTKADLTQRSRLVVNSCMKHLFGAKEQFCL
jgi:hypothetical protein